MKKKRLIMLFLQLALVVGFSASFYTYVQKEVEPTKVLVYGKDLAIGEHAKVSLKEIPAKAVQKNMYTYAEAYKEFPKELDKDGKAIAPKQEDVLKFVEEKFMGKLVAQDEFVYEGQLVEKGAIDPFETMDLTKYRKVSLPISYVEGFGGDVKRGDKVDLIFTGQGKKSEEGSTTEENFQYSKTFLQDVLVYNVTTDTGYRFDDHSQKLEGEIEEGGEEIATSGSTEELSVITLAVTLDQAEEISARKSIGTISFASRFEDNDSYETLGFVIGDYEKIFSAPANAETGRATINSGQ